ncbi:MAG: deaminase [Proteobacteria bacterium]|nr:MAG: deaminase [Pseudomonadota bacterium]
MAKLNYVTLMSLDGFIGDGHYDWSLSAKGSTEFITDVMRPFGTYLYGRKNFETMAYWETKDAAAVEADHQDFVRVWQAAAKIVYTKTLKSTAARRTRLEPEFDPAKIRELKAKSTQDLCIGGPTIAAEALRNNLVDEIQLFVVPTTIGSGIPVIPVLPRDSVLRLELIEERRFSEGWVYLRYRVLS